MTSRGTVRVGHDAAGFHEFVSMSDDRRRRTFSPPALEHGRLADRARAPDELARVPLRSARLSRVNGETVARSMNTCAVWLGLISGYHELRPLPDEARVWLDQTTLKEAATLATCSPRTRAGVVSRVVRRARSVGE